MIVLQILYVIVLIILIFLWEKIVYNFSNLCCSKYWLLTELKSHPNRWYILQINFTWLLLVSSSWSILSTIIFKELDTLFHVSNFSMSLIFILRKIWKSYKLVLLEVCHVLEEWCYLVGKCWAWTSTNLF